MGRNLEQDITDINLISFLVNVRKDMIRLPETNKANTYSCIVNKQFVGKRKLCEMCVRDLCVYNSQPYISKPLV